ncbi:hypothetical protein QJS04_geneDACA007131 [Acorus gramineus]|uniref:Uncharacterized protein n=1 Tax=Acorus gramineus TaxID=55184 RepID=A0AAV9BNT7_ACOGR|nr:hypothetical protein QJS04_geneDACA007131 [Acorus gramineus]
MSSPTCCSTATSTSTSTSSPSANTTVSPSSGKRSRDADDELCLDNFHSHKRYLSEIMASSLNGLSVGEPLNETLMESSPSRDPEVSLQYSPMSEDSSDDARYFESTPAASNSGVHQPEFTTTNRPTSPVSPHRQRPKSPVNPYPLLSYNLPSVVCSPSPSRPQRATDSEGRFPSSPNDMCHPADLRRAALLRSVQMRAHPQSPPPPQFENMQCVEEIKSLGEEDEKGDGYHRIDRRVPSLLDEEFESDGEG